jgi:hypothetical protein
MEPLRSTTKTWCAGRGGAASREPTTARDHAKAARNAAIVDAMALGIPRGEIADAAGLHPRRLYQILDRTPPVV